MALNPLSPWQAVPRDPLTSSEQYNFLVWVQTTLNSLIGQLQPLNAPASINTVGFPSAVQVVWAEVSGAASYQIFEGANNTFPDAKLVGTVPATRGQPLNSYTRTGLANQTTRFYFVRALTASGQLGTPTAGVGGKASSVPLSAASTLDNIPDGTTRHAVNAVDPNHLALIDFTQSGHTGKNLDNVPDGATRIAPSATRLNAAMDNGGNLLLKNIAQASGSTSGPSTNSGSFVVITDMTKTISVVSGKAVFIDFMVALLGDPTLTIGVSFAIFKDGNQLSPIAQLGINPGAASNMSFSWIDLSPTIASHTYDVRWLVFVGGGTVSSPSTNRGIQVVELA